MSSLLGGWSPAWAQSDPGGETPIQTVPHADNTFGYALDLLAGWQYDRSRTPGIDLSLTTLRDDNRGARRRQDWIPGEAGSVRLLHGTSADGRQSLQIVLYRTIKAIPFPVWVEFFEKRLARLSEATQIKSDPRPVGDRVGAVIRLDSQTAGVRSITHYYCIPFDPFTIWVMVFISEAPDGSESLITRAFEKMAGSLRILYDTVDPAEAVAEFQRGRQLNEILAKQAKQVQFDVEPRYYELLVDDKPVGALERIIRHEERDGDQGVTVREESWMFLADGTVRWNNVDLFCSFDGQSELIGHRKVIIPPKDFPVQRAIERLDRTIRVGDTLFSSLTSNLDTTLPEPRRPILLNDDYMPLIWTRLIPGFLSAGEGAPHAFTIYDAPTRALVIHRVRRVGRVPYPEDPSSEVWLFEFREGYAETPTKVFADTRGRVLREEAGGLVVQLTTRTRALEQFADRIAGARKRLAALTASDRQSTPPTLTAPDRP